MGGGPDSQGAVGSQTRQLYPGLWHLSPFHGQEQISRSITISWTSSYLNRSECEPVRSKEI